MHRKIWIFVLIIAYICLGAIGCTSPLSIYDSPTATAPVIPSVSPEPTPIVTPIIIAGPEVIVVTHTPTWEPRDLPPIRTSVPQPTYTPSENDPWRIIQTDSMGFQVPSNWIEVEPASAVSDTTYIFYNKEVQSDLRNLTQEEIVEGFITFEYHRYSYRVEQEPIDGPAYVRLSIDGFPAREQREFLPYRGIPLRDTWTYSLVIEGTTYWHHFSVEYWLGYHASDEAKEAFHQESKAFMQHLLDTMTVLE